MKIIFHSKFSLRHCPLAHVNISLTCHFEDCVVTGMWDGGKGRGYGACRGGIKNIQPGLLKGSTAKRNMQENISQLVRIGGIAHIEQHCIVCPTRD